LQHSQRPLAVSDPDFDDSANLLFANHPKKGAILGGLRNLGRAGKEYALQPTEN
jgi:hypothetical protein